MPELPEVETMCRGISRIVGSTVQEVQFVRTACKPIAVSPSRPALRSRLIGRIVRDVTRAGKRVVVWFEGDVALVFEPRMTGLVLLANPPDHEHLRVRIQLAGPQQRELCFWDRRGLGSVRLYSAAAWSRVAVESQIGPDALAISCDELRTRLGSRRRPIKVALLDQHLLAGIGNLYASEILHVARLHPERFCHRLTPSHWSSLHQAIRQVLEEAIRYEGSTLADGTYRNALNEQGGYQNHHRVYDLAGRRCASCRRGIVRRLVLAQRSTFYCPVCQRKAG